MTAPDAPVATHPTPRVGLVQMIVGGALVLLSWLVGVVTFFLPPPEAPWTWLIFLPGLVFFGDFVLAIIGVVRFVSARTRANG